MIRINLLPKQEVRESRGRGEFYIGLLAIISVFGVIMATHYSQMNSIEEVRREVKVTEKKIEGLKDVEEKVEEFKEKNKELERRIKVIADLEKKRSGPLYVMDSLSGSIPEKAWIDELKSKGTSATISGVAWNEFTVADFMESLQESAYFKNVNLKVIKKTRVNNLPLRSFEILSFLNFTGEQETKEEVAEESL